MHALKRRLSLFARDTSGNVTIEFVLAMPILFWTFMACYVFFDGYRQSSLNLKAAYTISDLISRETEGINDAYIDSMVEVMRLMTRATSRVDVRISVIRWDEGEERYYLDWSANRGYPAELTDANISDIESQLPVMPDNERVILVETNNVFVPLFNVGLDNINLDNFVFTRPRFVSQLVWETPDDYPEDNSPDDPV
ncbi:pilus assembly protein [Arenibacterium halophilum]|uniref:Pilus assembly protein n=2 Tax=Arenibacterium halophilum TaxID=2583821 RepID=A0ABY2XBJ1_9RHOB|nr:pilus assembly protein [Arenibacterium halophilum]